PVAARNPGDVAALMDWMNNNGLAAEVLKWNEKLPPGLTSAPPPAVEIAKAFAETKNWSRLKRWTRGGSWTDSEYLRLAYQAYAARQSRQSGADAEYNSLWHSAERAAADQPERDASLARLATRWGLATEAKQLWKRVAKHPPMRREALDSLFRIYRAENDLPELLQITNELHESSPREPALAANYARLALLLAPETQQARRLAKEAYEAAPTDVNFAITYALSLYAAGRTGEGLELLKQLPPDDLSEPHAAVYAATLYIDENQLDLAKPYIAAAQKGQLFPEEKKLLDETVAKAAALAAAVSAPQPQPSASVPQPPQEAPAPPPSAAPSPAESPPPSPHS
nr:hypothetical protein [Chthoniobacterales bacterium]